MVIDVILDRKDDEKEGHFDRYNPKEFYDSMMDYADMGGEDIASAMDGGTEEDVKAAICRYIKDYGYNPAICKWVKSVSWLGENESCTKKEGCKSSMQKKKESLLCKKSEVRSMKPSFQFYDTEAEAQAAADAWNAHHPTARKHQAHVTPWSSADGTEKKWICWTYIG